jgi:hypothetical protein
MSESKPPGFRQASDDSLLDLVGGGQPQEAAKIVLMERTGQRLIEALNTNSASGRKLSTRVFWLNLVLATATVLYAVATLYQAFYAK